MDELPVLLDDIAANDNSVDVGDACVKHDCGNRIGGCPHIDVGLAQENYVGLFAGSKRADSPVKPETFEPI